MPMPPVQPQFQSLFGGAHSSVYSNTFHAAGHTGAAPSGNTFARAVGGAIDIDLARGISTSQNRLLADSLGKRAFPAHRPFNQDTFRYLAGMNFTF
jgi:hypothetical protein